MINKEDTLRVFDKLLSLLKNEEALFYVLFLTMSLVAFFLLFIFRVSSLLNEIGWIVVFLVIVATLFSHILLKFPKREMYRKILRTIVVKFIDRLLPLILALSLATLSFTITTPVREFPLVFSYGKDSLIVGGQIGGDNNLTFVAHSFPLDTAIFQVDEVVNITNRDADPHSFSAYLYDKQTDDLSKIRLFKVFIKTHDGRNFPLLEIKNGTTTLDESIGFLLPAHTTWSLGMVSQGGGFKVEKAISLKFEIRMWLNSAYTKGMVIEIKFISP